ncbi:MBL fold metallo-hydrolase [Eubacteriales bacterium OttesenSCG-928-M02]|nr:MBL fold metallo-hydrolase [Eubacteriales bacterium OttesenSCG-928-M02]
MADPRPIKSNLKSRKILSEEEKPIRWSFMKVLREYSTLKREYAINPYAEVYPFRDNLYCIYTESLDGAGDPWMYLIDGPEKCMLIDTGFGVGDLKGLIEEIVGNKPIIVANTHSHFDHAYGNCQFDTCYCHEYEMHRMAEKNNPHIWDYLFDENGKPIWTEFDREDIVPYKEYEIIGVPDGHVFDLGGGYLVEAVLLPGHTPGQCAYYDLENKTIFIGDTTNIGRAEEGEPHGEYCTVTALRDALLKLQPRFSEIQGVFPGHGMLDQASITLQYLLDTAEAILKNPTCYDGEHVFERHGIRRVSYTKNVYQGSAIRYSMENLR